MEVEGDEENFVTVSKLFPNELGPQRRVMRLLILGATLGLATRSVLLCARLGPNRCKESLRRVFPLDWRSENVSKS